MVAFRAAFLEARGEAWWVGRGRRWSLRRQGRSGGGHAIDVLPFGGERPRGGSPGPGGGGGAPGATAGGGRGWGARRAGAGGGGGGWGGGGAQGRRGAPAGPRGGGTPPAPPWPRCRTAP